MGRERWSRNADEEIAFDWRKPALSLAVPIESARLLYLRAKRTAEPWHAEQIYLRLLRAAAAELRSELPSTAPARQPAASLSKPDVGRTWRASDVEQLARMGRLSPGKWTQVLLRTTDEDLLGLAEVERAMSALTEGGEDMVETSASVRPTAAPILDERAAQIFGEEARGIAVHKDAGQARGAEAATVGAEVFVAARGDADEQIRLGHELAHAIQQGRGVDDRIPLTRVQRNLLEIEAEAAGRAFAAGLPFQVQGRAPAQIALYRGNASALEPDVRDDEATLDSDALPSGILSSATLDGRAVTQETRPQLPGRSEARRGADPFFDGLFPSLVNPELENPAVSGAQGSSPGRGHATVAEHTRLAPAGDGAEARNHIPGVRELLDVQPARRSELPTRMPEAGPLLVAAVGRTFGTGTEIAVETGIGSLSGDDESRGHALGGRAFVAAAAPDLVVPADRQLIGHEIAHALQQRRGSSLAPSALDGTRHAALEAEAIAAGRAFSAGERFAVSGSAPPQVVLFDGPRKQIVHMTLMAGGLLVLELDDHTRESIRTTAPTQLPDGSYTFNTATRQVVISGPARSGAGTLQFQIPRDARLDGLATIPLEVTGGLGGLHAGHRIEATPFLAVAVPGTHVTYYVGMDPEIGGSYDYRWYCINDPASVGGDIPPRVDGPTSPRWEDAQWAVPGRHTVVCELTFHGDGVPTRTERLEFVQQVNTEQQTLADVFGQAQAPDYARFRAGLELHNLDLGGGMQDQRPPTGPYIRVAGANPAVPGSAPDLAYNTYTIVPSPNAVRFHWYVRCASWELMPTRSFFGYSRVQIEGQDAYELGSDGLTARFIIADRNRYTIVCDEFDAHGHRVGRASYVQIVESQNAADERARFQQYMQHADAAIAQIAANREVGVRAVYVNRETGERVPLQLYVGPSAGDPHRIALVDLLPGVGRLEYGGNTIDDAINDFDNGNAYPVGSIQLEVPANRSRIPPRSRTLTTRGASLWSTWSQRIGWASLGLAGAGVVAALIPGGQPVAAAFFIAAAGAGAAASGLSLYDRLQQAEPSPVGIALDVAGIAASVIGGATAFRALAVGTALTFTGATGRFLFYSGFATNAVAGLLITVEGVDEINHVLDSPMPTGEKVGAIVRIVANLVVQGSLLALSVRSTNQLRVRIGALIGEEAAGALQVDVLHSLNLLDDDALRALRGLPRERLLVVAEITRTSPRIATQLTAILDNRYLSTLSDTMRPRYERLMTEIFNGTVTGSALEQRLQVLSEVASIRSELQGAITGEAGQRLAIGQRNIAYGDVDLRLPNGQAITENVVSVSGLGTSNTITGQVGSTLDGRTVVPEIARAHQTFAPLEGRAFHDSERKLFEHILDQIERRIGHRLTPGTSYQGQGFSGRITVNTEMNPCASCADVMGNQFRQMFGSDVTVVINSGVQYP